MKAIFIDKDGTLVDDLPYNVEPRRITLCSGAGAALRLLARLDYRLFVLDRQGGIAFGDIDETAMDGIGRRLRDLLARERLALDGFYYCPHHPHGSVAPHAIDCHCRRPLPGLLLQAAHDHGIDLRASWMVGAVLHDVEAGNRAGCRTILLDNGRESEWRLGPRRVPTRMAPDLYAAAVLIASHGAQA
jgi:D,D-heptose 1,7-bisphosphate phosphatase